MTVQNQTWATFFAGKYSLMVLKKTFSKVFYDLYLPYPNFIIFLPQVNINPAYQIPEMEYTLRKVNRRFFYSQSIAEMSAASHLKFCTILILLHDLGILIWLLLDCEDDFCKLLKHQSPRTVPVKTSRTQMTGPDSLTVKSTTSCKKKWSSILSVLNLNVI